MTGGRTTGRIAGVTITAAALVLLAGPSIEYAGLGWQAGLCIFALAALVAGLGGVFCLAMLIRRRASFMTVLAAAAGIAALVVPVAIGLDGRNAPPINDITTDTANPPEYRAITADMRGPDSVPLGYDPAIAAGQLAAYPKVTPLIVADAPVVAFDRALAAARAQGWAIIASDAAAGRIEATATVLWWGFKHDVVVRLTPQAGGTRIDVRSKSRVGKRDLGVNAKRITDYLAAIGGK